MLRLLPQNAGQLCGALHTNTDMSTGGAVSGRRLKGAGPAMLRLLPQHAGQLCQALLSNRPVSTDNKQQNLQACSCRTCGQVRQLIKLQQPPGLSLPHLGLHS